MCGKRSWTQKAFRRAKNLKDLLVRNSLPRNLPHQSPGTFPCNRTVCRTCLTVFSLVYPEEGSIAETSVKILIITASVLQFLNCHFIQMWQHLKRALGEFAQIKLKSMFMPRGCRVLHLKIRRPSALRLSLVLWRPARTAATIISSKLKLIARVLVFEVKTKTTNQTK